MSSEKHISDKTFQIKFIKKENNNIKSLQLSLVRSLYFLTSSSAIVEKDHAAGWVSYGQK